jgi:hypothetical protein
MDIRKFITSNAIDNKYNKMVNSENNTLRSFTKKNLDDKLNIPNKYASLYNLENLDFMNNNIERLNDPNISNFISNFLNDKNESSNVGFSGPVIKSIMSFDKETPIKKLYFVSYFGQKNINSVIKNDPKSKKINLHNTEYFIIEINGYNFMVDKKHYQAPSHAVLSKPNIERVIRVDNVVYVSGVFILELYKNMTMYDSDIRDPIFNYPIDILDIYEKRFTHNSIKSLIERSDFYEIKTINPETLESEFIKDKENKYSPLEYALLCMKNISNPVVQDVHLMIIMHLSKLQTIRPARILSKCIGFDKLYPALHDFVSNIEHPINITEELEGKGTITTYHIDMHILHCLAKNDDIDMFINFASTTGLIRKLKTQSKTGDKIVDWLISIKPLRIINVLLDCAPIADWYKFKIILLTQEIDLFGSSVIDQIISSSEQITPIVNQDKKIDKHQENEINSKQNEMHENPNDDLIECNIIDSDDNELKYDEPKNNESKDNESKDNESKDNEPKDNEPKYYEANEPKDNEIICRDTFIKNILPHFNDILKNGAIRSFLFVAKYFPEVLDIFREENSTSLLHCIESDVSCNIVELIVKKNAEPIDEISNGKSPLLLYSELGLEKCIDVLLKYNAAKDITDDQGENFIHKLCKYGHMKILQKIIRNNLEFLDIQNNIMKTPAILASENGFEEIFYILKGLNADLSLTDYYGNTAYHYICRNGICMGMIIPNISNFFGFRPSDYNSIADNFYHFQNFS